MQETETLDQGEQGTRTPSREHRHRRHHRSHRHHRSSSTTRLWLIGLSTGAVVGVILIIYLGSRIYALDRDNEALYQQLTDARNELEALEPELQRLRSNLQTAVQGRIPGLVPLDYDLVVPLQGEQVARNVVFNRTGQEGDWRYEFKMVLENNSLYVVWPRIRLYLFDDRGIQVGLAQLGDLAQVEQSQSLGPGEVRSVSGEIEMTLSKEPAYFMIESLKISDDRPAYESPAGLDRVESPEEE